MITAHPVPATPTGPHHPELPGAVPRSSAAPTVLSVVPAHHRPVCQCIPCVLAVADHHHCPLFRARLSSLREHPHWILRGPGVTVAAHTRRG